MDFGIYMIIYMVIALIITCTTDIQPVASLLWGLFPILYIISKLTEMFKKCQVYGSATNSKYLIKKQEFYQKSAYYVYKKNWLGFFKLVMHDNNNGKLETLEDAKNWIDEMEYKDYTSEKHYY